MSLTRSASPSGFTSGIYSLLDAPTEHCSPEYAAKMLHPLPACPTVDRTQYILEHVRGRQVLDVGASGPLHEAISQAAKICHGLDLNPELDVTYCDLDDVTAELPVFFDQIDIVVCGEILEHLTNPGHLLRRLRAQYQVPLLVSVPNAFSAIAAHWATKRGYENVNSDHTAWYSPKTLENLLTRAGWRIVEWACYNGTSPLAEGWIVRCEPKLG